MEWALIMAMSDPDISKFTTDIVEQVTSMFRAPDPFYQDAPMNIQSTTFYNSQPVWSNQPYYSGYNYGVCTTSG